MAETYDENFKAEMLDFKDQMLRFAEVAGQKFDGLASDIRGNSFRIDKVEQKLEHVEQNLTNRINEVEHKLSSKFDQVAEKVVDHELRIRKIEGAPATSPTVN